MQKQSNRTVLLISRKVSTELLNCEFILQVFSGLEEEKERLEEKLAQVFLRYAGCSTL